MPKHHQAESLHERLEKAEALLRWVGLHIRTRTAGLKIATKFCLLCSARSTKLRRDLCRHDEIWQYEGTVPVEHGVIDPYDLREAEDRK